MFRKLISFGLAALIVASGTGLAEAANIARVKGGNIPVYDGPGRNYQIIDRIPDGTEVELEFCTPELTNWCVVKNTGWVDGTYLVGSRAKMRVTPQFMPNPMPYRFMHFGRHPKPKG